jgi:hypothetical protein
VLLVENFGRASLLHLELKCNFRELAELMTARSDGDEVLEVLVQLTVPCECFDDGAQLSLSDVSLLDALRVSLIDQLRDVLNRTILNHRYLVVEDFVLYNYII